MYVALCYIGSFFVSIALIRLGFWLDSSNAKRNWNDTESQRIWFFVAFIPGLNVLLTFLAVLFLTIKHLRFSARNNEHFSPFFASFLKHLLFPRNYHK